MSLLSVPRILVPQFPTINRLSSFPLPSESLISLPNRNKSRHNHHITARALGPEEQRISSFASTVNVAVDETKEEEKKEEEEIDVNGESAETLSGELLKKFDLKVEKILDNMKWDEKGLAVAIAQNVDTGAILMQGFANREALSTTITSRKATFYSRSRSSLWTKGETSMNFINVHDIFIDCDRDSIIYLGKPDGPTCHTGEETCYYSSINDLLDDTQINKVCLASITLYSLENTISQRHTEIESDHNGKKSWTKKLLLDKDLLSSKIREEAGELIQTLTENEDKHRAASEMADLLYHAMVLLALKDVKMEQVFEILRKRFAQSGIEEKSSRKPKNQN